MTRKTGKLDLPALTSLCVMAFVLWCATAYLLYALVKPYMSLDNGRTFVFDALALAEATSIMTGMVILSWLPIFLFTRRWPNSLLAVLTSISTWILLGVPFVLIDKFGLFDVTVFRAARVMEDGNDLIFSPCLIPIVAVLSGATYFGAMWLSLQLKRIRWQDYGRAS